MLTKKQIKYQLVRPSGRENMPCTASNQRTTDFCTRSGFYMPFFNLAKHLFFYKITKIWSSELYFFCWGFSFCLCVSKFTIFYNENYARKFVCVSFLILLLSSFLIQDYCSNTIFLQELNRARHPGEWYWWPWGQLAKLFSWELYIPGNIEFCESEFRS